MKKMKWFVLGGILTVILYLIGIGTYTRLSSDPIIFFASLFIGIIVVSIVCVASVIKAQEYLDRFTVFLGGMVWYLGIIIFSIFGPTFIDRSISYHIAFYAVEENYIYIEDIEETLSNEIVEKRIHDALATGVLTVNDDGSISPTLKAKLIYYTLKPLGELTNSMDTYNNMKEDFKNAGTNQK